MNIVVAILLRVTLRNMYACSSYILLAGIMTIQQYIFLIGNHIDFIQETKYLSMLVNSLMNASIGVYCQTRKFDVQGNMSLHNFQYCGSEMYHHSLLILWHHFTY